MCFVTIFVTFIVGSFSVFAEELEPELTMENGNGTYDMTDDSYWSAVSFDGAGTLTITAKEKIYGLYIIWGKPVKEWTLTTDNGRMDCGRQGFLHEYISIDEGTQTAVMEVPAGMSICEVRAFGEGELPEDVQVWSAPCENADIMLISAHADDEILFFGGIIPTYGAQLGARIQIVYMTQFWDTSSIREHEKLDGLWASGLKYYPVSAPFSDYYSTSLEGAKSQYNLDLMVEFLVEQIRRFKPQVTVTHDFNGEYGHGYHMLVAEAVRQAVESAANPEEHVATVSEYGVWETKKSYYHLYPENEINLDLRQPLSSMKGMTALEVASEAYKMHVSQQWCWFYVSDEYEYSCARFGLYKSIVGEDENPDILDNLKTYDDMEEELRREEESRSVEESIEQSVWASSRYEEIIKESISAEASSIQEESLMELKEEQNIEKDDDGMAAVFAVLTVIGVAAFVFTFHKKK